MNIQRLKFAWARGARIQWISSDWHSDQKWYDCLRNDEEFASTKWADSSLRLHPEDEHLQYGPISAALREHAIYRDSPRTRESLAAIRYWEVLNGLDDDARSAAAFWDWSDTRAFYRLFVAELLADEGL